MINYCGPPIENRKTRLPFYKLHNFHDVVVHWNTGQSTRLKNVTVESFSYHTSISNFLRFSMSERFLSHKKDNILFPRHCMPRQLFQNARPPFFVSLYLGQVWVYILLCWSYRYILNCARNVFFQILRISIWNISENVWSFLFLGWNCFRETLKIQSLQQSLNLKLINFWSSYFKIYKKNAWIWLMNIEL